MLLHQRPVFRAFFLFLGKTTHRIFLNIQNNVEVNLPQGSGGMEVIMTVNIKFLSETVGEEGENLLKAAKEARIKLKDSCGGKGKCGKCKIKVVSGNLTKPTKREVKELGEEKIKEGYRLACQVEVIDNDTPVVIEVVNNKKKAMDLIEE